MGIIPKVPKVAITTNSTIDLEDTTGLFASIDFGYNGGYNAGGSGAVQQIMGLNGKLVQAVVQIVANTLTGNLVFEVYKNGVATGVKMTFKPTDLAGTKKIFPLNVSFEQSDIMYMTQDGNNAGFGIFITPSVEIDYK